MTMRCNLECSHCYCPRDNKKKELSRQELCQIIDELTQAGCLWLLITGGEPLTRPDFLDIYTYAKNKGLIITLFTNGTLVTPEIADYLQEWPPFSVEISLYGATKDTYENVTQVNGSYEKCLKGIELLIERNIPLKLKTMVMELNKYELEMMKSFAIERNLEFRFDSLIHPRFDGSKFPCQYRIPIDEAVEIELKDHLRRRRWEKVYQQLSKNQRKNNRLYLCSLNMWSFHINSYGRLQFCIMAQEPSFDLRKESFFNCWKKLINVMPKLKSKQDNKCKDCELFSLCAPCPAWAKLENGDPDTAVEYTCKIAHVLASKLKNNGFISKGGRVDDRDEEKNLQKTRGI